MTIIGRIVAYILAALLLISVGFNVFQHFEADHYKDQVTELTTTNAGLKTEIANCKGNLDNQNKAIADQGKATQQQQKNMDDLNDQLKKQQDANQKLIDVLAKQPAPKTCQDAAKYLKDALGDYK